MLTHTISEHDDAKRSIYQYVEFYEYCRNTLIETLSWFLMSQITYQFYYYPVDSFPVTIIARLLFPLVSPRENHLIFIETLLLFSLVLMRIMSCKVSFGW